MKADFKIGLALGGGAARALSHIGVIAGLNKHGIPIHVVTGTSMGAVIGAMYAARPDLDRLQQRMAAYLESEEFRDSGLDFIKEKDAKPAEGLLFRLAHLARRGLFNTLAVTRTAFVEEEIAAQNYAFLLEDIAIEETRIPFAATALDLHSGDEVLLDRGRLRQAVAASCAIPGILQPVALHGRLLVDGGWAEAVPVRAAYALGADFVIAVEVGGGPGSFDVPRNTLDVAFRADLLVRRALVREQLKQADFVLAPNNGVSHWADFSAAERTIASGAVEVDRRIGPLLRQLRGAKLRAWFGLGRRPTEGPVHIGPAPLPVVAPVPTGGGL